MIPLLLLVIVILVIYLVYILAKNRKVDGEVVIQEKEGGGKLYSLELQVDPDEIDDRRTVTFRVRK